MSEPVAEPPRGEIVVRIDFEAMSAALKERIEATQATIEALERSRRVDRRVLDMVINI